jgi:hypothetical protein
MNACAIVAALTIEELRHRQAMVDSKNLPLNDTHLDRG